MQLINSCLLIIKVLKIQDGCQISPQQNVSATDVPFLLILKLAKTKCFDSWEMPF